MATGAGATDSGLRRMDTGEASRGWEAVGRLNIGGKGFCTGALIAPDMVLTAAHCLFDRTSKARIDPAQIEFRAGWRNGRAETYRSVKQAVVHPDYQYGTEAGTDRVLNDLAVLKLYHPVRGTSVVPYETAGNIAAGTRVGVVSYAHDRSEAPSFQEMCQVLGRQKSVYITSCNVDFGSSGAPIFVFDNGVPRIVSVVSAKAVMGDQPVALGVTLDGALGPLLAELSVERVLASGQRLGHVGGRARVGAKFIKP